MSDRGPLVIIGGHEDRQGDKVILRQVSRYLHGGKLVIVTVASEEPKGLFDQYRRAFHKLGVKEVAELRAADRGEAKKREGG